MDASEGAVAGPVPAAAEELIQVKLKLEAAQANVDAAVADKAWGAVAELTKRVNYLQEKVDQLTGAAQDGAGGGSGAGGAAAVVVHVLRTKVLGSKHIKGVRARLFREAVSRAAHYTRNRDSQQRTPAFTYEGDDLVVTLGFEFKQDAVSMETWLLQANGSTSSSWFMHQRVPSISVESTDKIALQERVVEHHYVPAEFESPADTYDDLAKDAGSSRSSAAQLVAINAPIAVFQSVEKKITLDRDGVEKAHIIPKGESKKRKIETEDNMLALSRGLHGAFDGPPGGVPRIAIRPYELGPFESCPDAPERKRVYVAIECVDKAYDDSLLAQLKEGARREVDNDSGATIFVTWVHVKDPHSFCSYLSEKYKETMSMWHPE